MIILSPSFSFFTSSINCIVVLINVIHINIDHLTSKSPNDLAPFSTVLAVERNPNLEEGFMWILKEKKKKKNERKQEKICQSEKHIA